MTEIAEREVSDARRIRQFASFFKNYMGASTILVAALPVPVAQLQMIPTHAPDRGSISVISSLLCFLLVAYVFYNRHGLAMLLFPPAEALEPPGGRRNRFRGNAERWRRAGRRLFTQLILLLILASVACFFYYQLTWIAYGERLALLADDRLAEGGGSLGFGFDETFVRMRLMVSYVVFFALAETAFVLMATKEYLQELLGLSDREVIFGPAAIRSPAEPPVTAD